ncbi:hypothetical protein C8J57DRAFT_1090936 [Mycena rebaudengoi]|nr:hypothetical protein C8J57DRAFT_1092391 [Mycena rebaudengoi]KAJ7232939.1 hypothetical protein C8J57DRAFT_1090936 [Mycena rebaudengoi]
MGLVEAAVTNSTAAAATPAVTQDVSSKLNPPHPLSAGITCTNFQIVPNTADISAFCADAGGTLRSTRITLGNCIGNQDGNLGCQLGGGASGSCVFFDLFQTATAVFISAHCTTRSGGSKETDNFNLDPCFTNINGQLAC